MAYATHCNSIIRNEFLKPLFEVFHDTKYRRNCPVLDDVLWLEGGVRRCINLFQSGRDFLQNLAEEHETQIRVSTFFESLKSKRRLSLLDEVSRLLRARMKLRMPDPFVNDKCLEDFDIFAGDGHFVAAATHDKAMPRTSTNDITTQLNDSTTHKATTKHATGHLYTLDLRSHAMSHLTVADQITRKKEHEMRSLKRQTADVLRQGAPKGRKILYIWDRAGIDFQQWFKWKNQNGIYFLSRAKDNIKLQVLGKHSYDTTALENTGIEGDELAGTSMGVSIRRVTYRDLETGILYIYLTNLPASVSPGIIALLYKSRWDIEKVFDEFKNKLGETKSWASSATAKTNQARLICLTHNLMTLMEEVIRERTGVCNQAELKRKNKIRANRVNEQKKRAGSGNIPHLNHAAERLTQRTVKFIRWLKNHLNLERSWDEAITKLSQIYQHS